VALEKDAGSSPVGHPPIGKINIMVAEKVSRHGRGLDFLSSAFTLTLVAQPALALTHDAVVAVAVDALGGVAQEVEGWVGDPPRTS
jgi:hypothetical protein